MTDQTTKKYDGRIVPSRELLGNWIRSSPLSVREISERCGVDKSSIQRYSSCIRAPKHSNLILVGGVCQVGGVVPDLDWFESIRDKNDMTQKEFVEGIDLSRASYNKIVNGRHGMRFITTHKLFERAKEVDTNELRRKV